jgi:serine/threonine protein phosphatase 1
MQSRTLVIGDIHGNFNALKEVLSIARFKIDADRLICLGDYIDGYDQPVEVVDYLIEINDRSPFENIFIMGNHDAWLVDALNDDLSNFRDQDYIEVKYSTWIRQGGEETYHAYLALTDEKILQHKSKFYDLLKYYHISDNKLYVHAGFDPDIGFEATKNNDYTPFLWNRSLFERAYTEWRLSTRGVGSSEDIKITEFDTIYIGHTPTINFGISEPIKMGNVLNLDQGCKIDGRLTAWVEEEGTYFQSKGR